MNAMNRQSGSAGRTVLVLTEPGDTTADLVVERTGPAGRAGVPGRCRRVPTVAPGERAVRRRLAWRDQRRGTARSTWHDIRSVYVRRPTEFVFPASMTDAEQRFAAREARRGIGGLLMSLPCSWVNHPSRAADAEYKPFQLAMRGGLRIERAAHRGHQCAG